MDTTHGNRDVQQGGPSGLIARTSAALKKYGMLRGGETVLVGLSGGPDSVCLLHLLHHLWTDYGLKLCAVYVNHNLRPDEVPAEIGFCRDLCKTLGVPLVIKSVDPAHDVSVRGRNLHEAARELRYRAFEEAAAEARADRIALGHNADDQTETFFMRLLRGAGPKGLSGIPAIRGTIIRPLIETERREIEAFLRGSGIRWMTDSSNLKPDYFRNRVRQQLMPALRRLSPEVVSTVVRTMSILREEERYFDIVVTKNLMKMISRKTPDRIELFMAPIEILDRVILRRVLRRAIDETAGLRGIGLVHIEEIMKLLRDGKSGDRITLPNGIRVIKDYALLVITAEPPSRLSVYELQPPCELPLREAGVVMRAHIMDEAGETTDGRREVVLDAGKMTFPLKVRPRTKGDIFFPMGFGHRKKLQDFFVDGKVPRDERDSIPVVLSGNDIIWVAGYRADERFRPSGGTKKFLRLGIVKGNF